MPVSFIAHTNGEAPSAVGSITISHSISAGSDTALIVTVGVHRWGKIMNSVVIDPTNLNLPLNKFASVVNSFEGSLWERVAPPVGTFNVVCTGSSNQRMGVTVADFSGVDQTTPLENAQTNTGTSVNSLATPSIISGADDITIARLFTDGSVGTLTADGSQVLMQNANINLGQAVSSRADPGEALMGCNWDTGRNCGIVGANIKSAGGGGPIFQPAWAANSTHRGGVLVA